MDLLLSILSSGIIAALVTALFATQSENKKRYSEKVTDERKNWRDELRDISAAISRKTSPKEIFKELDKLKVRINTYGINGGSVLEDNYLWTSIHKFENKFSRNIKEKDYSAESVTYHKRKIIDGISLVLKDDWDRSKREVVGSNAFLLVILSLVACFILLLLPMVEYAYTQKISIFKAVSSPNSVATWICFAYIATLCCCQTAFFKSSHSWNSKSALFSVPIWLVVAAPPIIVTCIAHLINITTKISLFLPMFVTFACSLMQVCRQHKRICKLEKVTSENRYINGINEALAAQEKAEKKAKKKAEKKAEEANKRPKGLRKWLGKWLSNIAGIFQNLSDRIEKAE